MHFLNNKIYTMIDIAALPVRELFPGYDARLIHSEQASVSFITIKKGSSLPLHKHINEQITYIVEGELQMTIGEETMILTAGKAFIIQPNVLHNAYALTDCKAIDFFTPVREDYK